MMKNSCTYFVIMTKAVTFTFNYLYSLIYDEYFSITSIAIIFFF